MPEPTPARARRSRSSLLLLALTSIACGSASTAPERDPPRPRPRVVVAVVIDQLAAYNVERYLPYLDEAGGLRRTIARGAFHRDVEYAYASTYTAAGHTAIYTGAPPAVSRVVANDVWDRARRREVPIVDDGEHAILGVEGAYASPRALRVETVADALAGATGGRAIIASLSFKDRGAVFAGGRGADLVLFYDHRRPGFTTSTFYADALPPWLADFEREHPVESLLEPWTAGDPELLGRIAGEDDARGEGDWLGFGTTFPHDPRASERPYSVARATPRSSEYLLELATRAVRELGIGEDDIPDLLAISISSTDYAAHVFGPDSWEYVDDLVRTDRALGAFLDRLERERGPVAVLITSDHGGAPLPERAGGGRILPSALAIELDGALDHALGEREWVSAFVQPFVYFTDPVHGGDDRDRAAASAVAWLSARREIELAVDAREAPRWRDASDPVRRAVGLSVPDDAGGDVFVVPAERFVVDEAMPAGFGTSHGTPWAYDRTVTVAFAGPGVAHLETHEPLAQSRVASTISSLLAVDPPKHAARDPLPGTP